MNDYHIHLHDHGESGPYTQELVSSFVEMGTKHGVTELGFTEHIFRFREVNELLGEWWAEDPDPHMRSYCERYVAEHSTQSLEEYVEVLTAAKSREMPVKIGLEIDYYPRRMGEIDEFLSAYPLDFRLGSVHWIGAWGFDDPGVGDEWRNRDIESVWIGYFALLADLISSDSVDVLAHPDLVKKFGHRPAQEPVDLYRQIAEMAAERSIAFELSSAGLRKPVGEAYPSSLFLEAIRSAGASITTASDAHKPQDVGADFDRLSETAISAGFTEAVSFTMRNSHSVRL
ncbi:MAG: hypothetical protein DCC49_00615 [Acidobacteria bacterium]|nr:MAG: hypothetical protein DCC49_00615 [Acidobacteriota bacterium]